MKSKIKFLSIASVAALGLVSCANDEQMEVFQGEEIKFTSRVSRAVETSKTNLTDFIVYANSVGFDNMLIDSLTATYNKTTELYDLERKITWPTGVSTINFWAYGPAYALKNLKGKGFSPSITKMSQQLNYFTAEANVKEGGVNHKDLVVAYASVERHGDGGTSVPLTFNHALSQVAVRIKKGGGFETGRVVKVRGAWVVNVHSKGNLEFNSESDKNHHMKWTTSEPAMFGRLLDKGQRLGDTDGIAVISNEGTGGEKSTLMVPPQSFVKYDFGNSASVAADDNLLASTSNHNPAGTYILVLCRVETEHHFAADSTSTDAIGSIEGGHVHQLFPVVKKDGKPVFDANAYGYTCVPISGEWLPGKKYIYTLEFCGKNSGAGVYPPEDKLPEGLPEGEKRPDDKHPGDPVLDSPISFTVEVDDWTGGWSDANGGTTPMK